MRAATYVPDFSSLRVAVVGDLIADHYVFTRPSRVSSEAPVMILGHRGEELRAGGAANVARNLWSLGARVRVVGIVGRDSGGRELLRLLASEQLDVSGVEAVDGWVTPTKMRVCAAESSRTYQQVLRVDREPEGPPSEEIGREVSERVRALAGQVDALLISDYRYGLVGSQLADAARELAAMGTTVVLDPRTPTAGFRELTAMTPNRTELAAAVGVSLEELDEPGRLAEVAQEFLAQARPEWLLVTLGNLGMALFAEGLPKEGLFVEASGSREGLDATGAGDTAAAAFTMGLAAGLDGPGAMRIANAASGVVVMENGTAVCSSSRLRAALARAPQPGTAGVEAIR